MMRKPIQKLWAVILLVLVLVLALSSAVFGAELGYREGGATSGEAAFSGTCQYPGRAWADDDVWSYCDDGEYVDGSQFALQSDVPTGADGIGFTVLIKGIVNNATGYDDFNVQLSWDGGSTWTSSTNSGEVDAIMWSPPEYAPSNQGCSAFGHAWTYSQLSDANFRVRVTADPSSSSDDMWIDDIDVRVCYSGAAVLAADIAGGLTAVSSPSATLPAGVRVSHTDSGVYNNWESTSYQIEGQSLVCVDHSDHTSDGTDEEDFNVTAPSAPGTYDITFIAYTDDGCTANASAPFTLSDALTVGIFGDSFGVDDDNSVDGWTDSDGGGSGAAVRTRTGIINDNGYLRLRSNKYVTEYGISTSGLTNIHLLYTWGQDTDWDDGDAGNLVVQWKLSTASDIPANWNSATHDLADDTYLRPDANAEDWNLGSGAANTSIDIRFVGQTSEDDDRALVDDVLVMGVVEMGSPGITTEADPTTATVDVETEVGDTATLTGGNSPTGDVQFTLYSDDECTTPVFFGSGRVRDEFSNQLYGNQDGSARWSTDWYEWFDDGSPASGSIQIRSTPAALSLNFGVKRNVTHSIEREANLSGATSAFLSFDYSNSGNLEAAGDLAKVRISTDGGYHWADLTTINANTSGSYSADISSYISSDTRVRFVIWMTSGDEGSDEYFYIDNVNIWFSPAPLTCSDTISGGSASCSVLWSPDTAGTYYWGASYEGDANNNGTSVCGGDGEILTVTGGCTPPSVTDDPDSVEITYGASASFTVAGTNYDSIQWQVSTDGGTSWSDLSGLTSETLALYMPPVSMTGNQFRAVLSSDCGDPAISAAATLTVHKADPTCKIKAYPVVYDGDPHGAGGMCTGVDGASLAGLDLGDSFTDVPGGTAYWTFIDVTGNYKNKSGSVAIVINKADPDCSVTGYNVTYDGNSHTATGSCLGVDDEELDGLDLSGTTHTNAGDYLDDPWTFTDVTGNYNDDSGTVDDYIGKATLTVTADNKTAQYSDGTPPLTFQYAGFQWDDDEGDIDTAPTCSTTRLPSDPASPPTFPITCSGGVADNYTFSYVAGTFTVTKEDATISLDNEVAFLVDNPGEDIDTLILYADVQETYPDAGYGPAAGEIDNVQVSMTLTPVGPGGLETGTCVKDHDNGLSGYDQINTYACTFTTVEVNTYLVEANVVGSYYTGGPAEDVLVVYDPSLGFTTAGGWFYWPGTEDKTNFGYTMKYNKKGNKVQGSLLLIRHTVAGNYRVKSNALDGLALGEFEAGGQFVGWASFSGKCTYQEPGWEDPEGNHVFLVYVEDWGEPGAGVDKLWFDVDGDEGNLSMTAPAQGHLEILDGGNIVVPHTPN